MIDKKHFPDNYSREFVPYKGFCKILKDGTTVEDENTIETDGPPDFVTQKTRIL